MPLLSRGNDAPLDVDDVWPLERGREADTSTRTFSQAFADSSSIPRAFFRSFRDHILLTGLLFLVATAMVFGGPIVLNHIVTATTDAGNHEVNERLALWIVALFVMQLVQALADNYATLEAEFVALELTTTLKNVIYDKALRLNVDARRLKATGDIVNLRKSDCGMIVRAATYMYQLLITPLQVVVAGVILYHLWGIASLAGFGVIGLTLGVNHVIRRDSLTMDGFQGRAYYGGNRGVPIHFDYQVQRVGTQVARSQELANMWELMKITAVGYVASWGLLVFVSMGTFGVDGAVLLDYVILDQMLVIEVVREVVRHDFSLNAYAELTGDGYVSHSNLRIAQQPLTPSVVFTSIALFQLIQLALRYLTDNITAVVKAKVAEERIAEFLAMPEVESDALLAIHSPQADEFIAKQVIVALENTTFTWSKDVAPVLRHVDLHIFAGEFVVVHGPVDCGKSSLCSALIGDMTKTQGIAYVGGSVAYCSQQPWIQHATVRDNILFGRPFDSKLCDNFLDACALRTDLKALSAGNHIEIGERGINLSSGQKARIALARACYSNASVFILDAPLAAVDAIVQNEIFHKCLLGILRHRTVLLVTHNPEIIGSDHVTRTITVGDRGQLTETRSARVHRPVHDSLVTPLPHRVYARETTSEDTLECVELTSLALGNKSPFLQYSRNTSFDVEEIDRDTRRASEQHRLVHKEERQHGRVRLHVFAAYYRAVGGFPVLFFVLLSQVLWQGLEIASDY